MANKGANALEKILSVDFLPEKGKIKSTKSFVIKEQVFDNKQGTTTLKATFDVDEMYVSKSEFSLKPALEGVLGAVSTFEAGIPTVDESGDHIIVTSTPHKWNLIGENTTETHLKKTAEVEVEPGISIRQTAVADEVMIDVPIYGKFLTIFGHVSPIDGIWSGRALFLVKFKETVVDEF